MADPLPYRPNPHNRPAEDNRLLLSTSKAERNCRLRGRHPSNPSQVAFDRICGRALRYFHSIRRFPGHHWSIRIEYPSRWTIHSTGFERLGGREEKCRTTCLNLLDVIDKHYELSYLPRTLLVLGGPCLDFVVMI